MKNTQTTVHINIVIVFTLVPVALWATGHTQRTKQNTKTLIAPSDPIKTALIALGVIKGLTQ